mmetsp:Transcript_27651/g.33821  ORF Transcript_27651/g.33821 Transcript_27651/m.33821 type:complete len:405 (+) Transcript_27651:87-1301(+)
MFGGIPFEHFTSADSGGPPRASKKVDNSKLYEVLGIDKNADGKTVKKEYRRLSRLHHPDRGGDASKAQEINAAYEILADPEKRKKYDKYGLEGLSEEGGGGRGPEDLFSSFFSNSRSRGPQRSPDVNHPIKASLEDLYNGRTVKLAITRKIIVGDSSKCTECDGRGVQIEMRQIGPGMLQQLQRNCSDCGGLGYSAKTKKERKVLEVRIEKGMKNDQKISFTGMSDEIPNMETGDVNFVVQEKENDLFQRKGADLLIVKTLSLNQALTGFQWKIVHLDGREIVIKSRPGEVIKPEGDNAKPFVKVLKDEGMPSYGNPFVKGDLYVLFRVTFPNNGSLSPDALKIIKEVLPDPDMEIEYDAEEVEEVHLDHTDVKHFGKGGAVAHNDANDSDDDQGGQGVQCQQS